MEELMALVEIFDLKILGEHEDLLSRNGGTPTITVEGDNGPVIIKTRGRGFHATGKIEGVPMRFFGDGIWTYIIDV